MTMTQRTWGAVLVTALVPGAASVAAGVGDSPTTTTTASPDAGAPDTGAGDAASTKMARRKTRRSQMHRAQTPRRRCVT